MKRFDHPVFHPNFEGHQSATGRAVVTVEEVEDVWFSSERAFFANRKRQGSYAMRGLTHGGRLITVIVLPTADPTIWLIYTAW